MITANKPVIHFNAVHISAPKPVEVVLTNESIADAQWTVVEEGEVPNFEQLEVGCRPDQPPVTRGVFTVTPGSGILRGSGIENPKQQRVHITMHPPSDGPFEKRIRFAVNKGRGWTLVCIGEGVYDEHLEHHAKLKVLK